MLRIPNKLSRNETINTGFGAKSLQTDIRIFDKYGKPNIQKKGLSFFEKYSAYHTIVELSWTKFYLILFLFYFIINLFFACIYFSLGTDSLNTNFQTIYLWDFFIECYFFSSQTLTTVGYGHLSPNNFWASLIASIEAIIGVLGLAVATSLLYSKFIRPKSFIKFSNNILITPHKENNALMFRMAPFKNTQLSESEVFLSMVLKVEENGIFENKYFRLDTEISKISSFILSWTVVHPINENSPIFGFTKEDLINSKMELIIYLKSFDDKYGNNVVKNHSYISDDLVWGAKFKPMFMADESNNITVLDFDLLNDYDEISF